MENPVRKDLFVALTLATLLPGHATAMADELTGTLAKVKELGYITIGHREASVPFSYLDDKRQPVGFAIDICAKIVDAVKRELKLDKLEVQYQLVTASTRIPLLANGTIDLECGNTTNNAERQQQVWYTNTHFLTASRFVSKVESKIGSVSEPKGKDPKAYVISEEAFSKPEPYGIMLRKDDTAFKAIADAATTSLYQSPELAALYDKWFTQPIPPKGVNLDIPMSPAMKRAFEKPTDSPDPMAY